MYQIAARPPQPVARAHLPVEIDGVLGVERTEIGVRYLLPPTHYLEDPLGHPGTEGVNRVGMSEPVGVQVGYAGTFSQALEDLDDTAWQQRLSVF